MARKRSKIRQKVEGITSYLRLGVVAGSAYLLYRKFQRDKEEEQALMAARQAAQAAAQARQAATAGATVPLVSATAERIPSQEPQVVPYAAMTPDKVATAQSLPAPQAQSLVPNDIAAALLTSISS